MRVISTLLLLMLMILGVFAVYRQQPVATDPVEYLPADTLLYINQINGFETFQTFKKSPLGRTVAQLDLKKIGRDVELNPEILDDIDEAINKIQAIQDDMLIRVLAGENCSLALLPKRNWSGDVASFEDYLHGHSLLISKPKLNISILDFIISHYAGKYEVRSVPYGKHTIKRFISDDSSVSVVFTDDCLLASYEERVLREALDIFDSPAKSLKQLDDFRKIQMQTADAERTVYFSFSEARKMTDFWENHIRSAHQQALLNEVSDLTGFTVAGYGAWRSDPQNSIIKDRVLLGLEREHLPPLTGKMLAVKPELNETLPFVLDDVLFYYWSNTINMEILWEMYKQDTEITAEKLTGFNQQVEKITNMDIDSMLSMFDNDISFLVRQSQISQFVPIPDFAVIVKLRDRKGMERLLQHVMEELDMSIQSRKYKTVNYNYWGLYPLESLQPVYTIYNGYLIVANTLDIFKTIVDPASYKDTLASSLTFAPIDPGLTEHSNSVCYVNQSALLSQMQELVSWGGTMLAIQDRQSAAKSKILIDELINPLLEGFSMYERSTTRTYIENEWIVTDLYTKLAQ